MKKLIAGTLCLVMISTSSPLIGDEDDIEQLAVQTDALYRTGAGAHDGAYTSLAVSMLGWGIGLAIAIGVVVAVIHGSRCPSPSPCPTTSSTSK